MSFLDKVKENNNYKEENKTPFILDNKRVGQIRDDYLDYILNSEIFVLDKESVTLIDTLKTFKERTDALRVFAQKAFSDGVTSRFMSENYPLIEKRGYEPLAFIDRSISTLLGSISFGQHLNAYVMSSEGMKMWIARRAYNKSYHAGKLDHLVAGGLPWDISHYENLKKECYEEAGMKEELVSQIKSVGLISYRYEYSLGGKEDIIYCYDIELDSNFTPYCTDGEVEEFYLMPIEEVADIVKNSHEFKTNCNLVIIDFLIRHGFIKSDDSDYIEITQRLRA